MNRKNNYHVILRAPYTAQTLPPHIKISDHNENLLNLERSIKDFLEEKGLRVDHTDDIMYAGPDYSKSVDTYCFRGIAIHIEATVPKREGQLRNSVITLGSDVRKVTSLAEKIQALAKDNKIELMQI